MRRNVVWRPCPACGRAWPHPADSRGTNVDSVEPVCDLTCLVCKEAEVALLKRQAKEFDAERAGLEAAIKRITGEALEDLGRAPLDNEA